MSKVMNELQIFSCDEILQIKEIEASLNGPWLGVYYAIEWGDCLKIGHTKVPYTRVMSLKRTAEKYGNVCIGRVCVSKAHTNHSENEAKLHKYFAEKRIPETELFAISLDEFISLIRDAGVDYKDESEKIGLKAGLFINAVKDFASGKDSMDPVTENTYADLIASLQLLLERLDAYLTEQENSHSMRLPCSEGEEAQISDCNLDPEN